MKTQGLLERVLVSHDAGWYRVGEPGGGRFRPFDTLFTSFLPALKASGFGEADVDQLIFPNPHTALARALTAEAAWRSVVSLLRRKLLISSWSPDLPGSLLTSLGLLLTGL